MKHVIYIVLILIFSVSCKRKKDISITEAIIDTVQNVNISSIGVTLSTKSRQKTASWPQYQILQSKIKRYNKTTISQALDDARELATLTKKAMDSIKLDELDRPDVKIRLNVLYNHALRLNDMATIPTISDEAVLDEVKKILDAFSSVNDKINVVYIVEEFDEKFKIISDNPIEIKRNRLLKAQERSRKVRENKISRPKKRLKVRD